jgi:ABC-type multidrug transport system fused ATPase/permease subunit
MQPPEEYERRLAARRAGVVAIDRAHLNLSNARLALAAVFVLLLWLAVGPVAISAVWPIAAALGFGALVVGHARVIERGERARRAVRMYQRGLDRLNFKWAGTGRGGDAFADGHEYARDLDLFGRGSLFELLNVTQTEAGESTLAGWLRSGAPIEEVRARHAAVEELRGSLDFREDLGVLAAEGQVSRTGAVAAWASTAPIGFGALRWVCAICAAVTVVLTVAAYRDSTLWALVVAWLVAESLIVWPWRRRLASVITRIGRPADDLALLAGLLARIERERFAAGRLTALQSQLSGAGVPASRAIATLTSLVSWYESSNHNLLFIPIMRAVLVPQQLTAAIDRWHASHGPHVADWLRVVGELEALSAIATYAYEHPSDPFPELADGEAVFDAEGLSHPLIRSDIAVANDVRLGREQPHVIVLSGSNMSGKSTLLRAAGLNVVLALAGAPVHASRIRLSPLAIGATLRVDDSLQEGHSRFYAEILRIRTIVATARTDAHLLFLLDEILHGTNSHDRRIGAQAIVRALADSGAIGLVTTHDLALTELTAELGARATNMHFEDRLEQGRMVFDYRMRPGVVEHSNALALMRAIGLDV